MKRTFYLKMGLLVMTFGGQVNKGFFVKFVETF